jgi:signal transduction histidine kinase/CheY-like chemotaxis protein
MASEQRSTQAEAADARRELLMRCDASGQILDADAVAVRLLGVSKGSSFTALSVEGSEEKARTFLGKATAQAVDDWELALMSREKPAMFSCAGRPVGDGRVDIYAVLMPSGYGRALGQLSESMEEVVRLNRDISRQRKELQTKNEEISAAHRELDESNRGVVSLHAELADRADTLRRASDVKQRLVANVSHEFRTPLHSILGLSRLLLEGSDGPLTAEQQKQLRYIRTSAEELSTLVNDLLDLSKAESGKAILRPQKFVLDDFIAAMRGMTRPLVRDAQVALVFEAEPHLVLETDQGKLSQILRNLISNALKFTERGEVRVTATQDGPNVVFAVSDTGVGIAPEHFDVIFEEFGQVDNAMQAHVKGTGLGLPLAQKLADLLGGTLTVASKLGEGSTFTLTIPAIHAEASEFRALESRPLDPTRAAVLVVEDDRKTIFIYEKFLAMAGFQVIPARDSTAARRLLETLRPAAIVLDIMLDGESSWKFLAELKQSPRTSDIPVLVVTVTNKEQKARALGADEFWLKPVDQNRLLRKLRSLTQVGVPQKVLVIDDDETARYLVAKFLDKSPYQLLQAETGPEGVRLAREAQPSVILLDFLLRGHTAFDVIDELKGDPRTRQIPVVVVTSHALLQEDRERLSHHAEAILSKENLSREVAINRIRDALRKAGLGSAAAIGDGVNDAGR